MRGVEFKEVLKKYRRQECTRDESKKLWDMVSDDNNESIIKEMLLEELCDFKVNESEVGTANFDGIYKNIESKIHIEELEKLVEPQISNWNNRFIMRFVKAAAIFILIFVGGGSASYMVFNHPEKPAVDTYNEIRAPLGSRSEVILPDGSKVWLNAGSVIRYLNIFNKENRCISLEGEAYFKVAKNKSLPFIVKTGDLNIVAVGTEFNVKAYDEEGIIETTLIEGKVSIQNNLQSKNKSDMVFLEPHQKAIYVKEDQQLNIEELNVIKQTKPQEVLKLKTGIMYIAAQVDPLPIISWKDNRLIFKGEELSSLLVKLERKYDVIISFESEGIRHFRFTGTLEDETLTQVLDVIKLSAPINYSLEGKKVMISLNKQMMKNFSGYLKKK